MNTDANITQGPGSATPVPTNTAAPTTPALELEDDHVPYTDAELAEQAQSGISDAIETLGRIEETITAQAAAAGTPTPMVDPNMHAMLSIASSLARIADRAQRPDPLEELRAMLRQVLEQHLATLERERKRIAEWDERSEMLALWQTRTADKVLANQGVLDQLRGTLPENSSASVFVSDLIALADQRTTLFRDTVAASEPTATPATSPAAPDPEVQA